MGGAGPRAPVSSRAGAGLERVSAAESKQARDPPFPSGSRASCSARGPVALARLRASGGRAWPPAPALGSRRGRGGRDGAARAARRGGRLRRADGPALSTAAPAPRGAASVGAGHRDPLERAGEMPNPKNSKGGRKNKRANSSGDEQENGAGALAAAGATGAAAGGALAAAAAGCGAVSPGAVGTGGAAGPGGAGAGAANAAGAAGAAGAGDAKNGKTTAAGRAPTSSPTGGRGGGGPGWRGRRVDNASQEVLAPPLRPAVAVPSRSPTRSGVGPGRGPHRDRGSEGRPGLCGPSSV